MMRAMMMSSQASRGLAAYEEVESAFLKYGSGDYIGEAISQEEHALQAANLASESGLDDDTVLAALLHDMGHVCGLAESMEQMGDCGVANHEHIGADWLLDLGFSDKCAELVRRHVDAKRYLCCVDKEYYAKLSDASRTTLGYQGGPMSEEEAQAFEADPLFNAIILMRSWDEQAKIPDLVVPPIAAYQEMIVNHVEGAV